MVATVGVGGQPQGIALDPRTSMVYVASLRGGTLTVLDGRTSRKLAQIKVGPNLQEIAAGPAPGTAYVANQEGSTSRRLALMNRRAPRPAARPPRTGSARPGHRHRGG